MPTNPIANNTASVAAVNERKNRRLTMRISPAQLDLLTAASRVEATTMTEFVLDAATTKAEEVLADRRLFALRQEDYRAFVALLDRPVQAKPRLRRLLAEPSAFER